jgi:putative ABC transport system substrate-binding protein
MQRRKFITLLGGAAAWPLTARAQQAAMPVSGLRSGTNREERLFDAIRQGLNEAGYVEGRNVAIEYRWAEGRNDRFAEFAAEFVRPKVDIIVTDGGAVVAAKQVTSVIPIVFAVSADPLGTGLIASLARPAGNVTGSTVQAPDLAGKRLELLREVVPGLKRLAILANADYPAAMRETGEVEAIARTLRLEITRLEFRRVEDIAPAIEAIKGRADALYVCTDLFANTNRVLINTLALEARLPTMHSIRTLAEARGLISNAADLPALFRRAGDFVDKNLRGAKPGDLPVEQPPKFELVFNLKTAKTLGLMIPESFLMRADEVIE